MMFLEGRLFRTFRKCRGRGNLLRDATKKYLSMATKKKPGMPTSVLWLVVLVRALTGSRGDRKAAESEEIYMKKHLHSYSSMLW